MNQRTVEGAPNPVKVKPRFRGVFHEAGFYVSFALAVPLIATAEPGRARVSAAVFATCVTTCFGASALYHRPTWRPRARAWLARLDHAGVYLLIAGSYTPVCLLVLSPGWRNVVLTIVWSGAIAATLLKFVWVGSPKWLSALIGLALGWVAAATVFQLMKIGAAGVLLIGAGGAFYTVGAIVYARRWPNPLPSVLGYHELFHLATVAAVACHYGAIAFYVLPRA